MKIKFIHTSLILLGITFSCCTNTSKQTNPLGCKEIIIDRFDEKLINLSDVFENIRFIPLETNNNCLLNRIDHIVFTEQNIVVLERKPKSNIHFFNKEGNYRLSIKTQGKGPNEYIRLADLKLNATQTRIEVLDQISEKLLFYDFDGNLIGVEKCKFFFDTFLHFKENSYAFFHTVHGFKNGEDKYNLKVKQGNKTQFYLPLDKALDKLPASEAYNFSTFENKLLFTHCYSNYIYELDENNFYAKYKINFGKYSIPEGFMDNNFKNVRSFIKECDNLNYAYAKINFLETNRTLFFTVNLREEEYHIFYSKSDNKYLIGNQLSYKIFDEDLIFTKQPLYFNGDCLAFVVESNVFLEKINSLKTKLSSEEWAAFTTNYKELHEIYRNTTQMSNPIIMFANIKN